MSAKKKKPLFYILPVAAIGGFTALYLLVLNPLINTRKKWVYGRSSISYINKLGIIVPELTQ